MKILLKKKVCGSREQCMEPTDRRKCTTQALKTLSKLHISVPNTFILIFIRC